MGSVSRINTDDQSDQSMSLQSTDPCHSRRTSGGPSIKDAVTRDGRCFVRSRKVLVAGPRHDKCSSAGTKLPGVSIVGPYAARTRALDDLRHGVRQANVLAIRFVDTRKRKAKKRVFLVPWWNARNRVAEGHHLWLHGSSLHWKANLLSAPILRGQGRHSFVLHTKK
jgi:hypothetical protein